MVLGFAEIRQHIIPAPAGIAELVPMVVICRLPAHVDHAVDRRTAAEDAAPRILDRTTVEARLRCRFEPPIGARIADAVEIADRDMHPVVMVGPTGLDQQNGVPLGQTVGQNAPRRAGTDDDVIKRAGICGLGDGLRRIVHAGRRLTGRAGKGSGANTRADRFRRRWRARG